MQTKERKLEYGRLYRERTKEKRTIYNRKYGFDYRKKNRRRILEKKRAYYLKNKQRIAAKAKAALLFNGDEIRAKARAYKKKNRDRVRKYIYRVRLKKRDHINALRRASYKRNVHKFRTAAIARNRKRLLLKLKTSTRPITIADKRALTVRQKARCAYCGKKKKLTTEHVLPLSCGGTHTIDNIVMACLLCNHTKKSKTVDEFIDYAKLVGYKLKMLNGHPHSPTKDRN